MIGDFHLIDPERPDLSAEEEEQVRTRAIFISASELLIAREVSVNGVTSGLLNALIMIDRSMRDQGIDSALPDLLRRAADAIEAGTFDARQGLVGHG